MADVCIDLSGAVCDQRTIGAEPSDALAENDDKGLCLQSVYGRQFMVSDLFVCGQDCVFLYAQAAAA